MHTFCIQTYAYYSHAAACGMYYIDLTDRGSAGINSLRLERFDGKVSADYSNQFAGGQ